MNTSKICTKCNVDKDISEYSKHATGKDGLKSVCKSCVSEDNAVRSRTKDAVILKMYNGQLQSAEKYAYKQPTYTKEEFVEYMNNSEDYTRLYDEWVESGYNKDKRPTCDRDDDYKGYSFDNITIRTLEDNLSNYRENTKNRVTTKIHKEVSKYDMEGNYVETYNSVVTATEVHKIEGKGISQAANGHCKSVGGFQWRFGSSKDNIGKSVHGSARRVDMLTLDGEYIKTFDRASHATKETGVGASSIGKCCSGKQVKAGGYKWKFTDKER